MLKKAAVSVSGKQCSLKKESGNTLPDTEDSSGLLWRWIDIGFICAGRLSDLRIILQSSCLPGVIPVTSLAPINGISTFTKFFKNRKRISKVLKNQNMISRFYRDISCRRLRIQQGLACDGFTPYFLLSCAGVHLQVLYIFRFYEFFNIYSGSYSLR